MESSLRESLCRLYITVLGTADIFESEQTVLFHQATPHQRSVINLLAEGIFDIREILENMIYANLDAVHEKSCPFTAEADLQNPAAQL